MFLLHDLGNASMSELLLHDYANNFEIDLHYGNILTAVLLPMRTSLFGFGIALSFLQIFYLSLKARSISIFDSVVAGLLYGSLPLINAHSFVALTIYCLGYLVIKYKTTLPILLRIVPVVFLVSLPQVLWILRQTSSSVTPFLRLGDGFLFGTEKGWLTYWIINGGILLPVAFSRLFFTKSTLRNFSAPLMILFVVGTFIYFQPNSFDNIKILLFFHLGASLLFTDFLKSHFQKSPARTILTIVIFVFSISSGFFSVIREFQIPCRMADSLDQTFAQSVLRNTNDQSVVLTAQKFNHPVPFLTGRFISLGFHNWLNQHGIDYIETAEEMKKIYTGEEGAVDLIKKYGITHIVVGKEERLEFPALNEDFLKKISAKEYQVGDYSLYRIIL